jgi:hypothetical protein
MIEAAVNLVNAGRFMNAPPMIVAESPPNRHSSR